jgi:inorganic pyrophosphatase
LIAVSTEDKTWAAHRDLSDLPRKLLREIEQFFSWILDVEATEHKLLGWRGVAEAERIIERGVSEYDKFVATIEAQKKKKKRL